MWLFTSLRGKSSIIHIFTSNMAIIENNELKITIAEKGAELQSIFSKKNNLGYMWDGDPAFWAKHSPVLFPIIGTLKNNIYFYNDKPYQLSRHGFAREEVFTGEQRGPHEINFLLKGNAGSLKVFPFEFELNIDYLVKDACLTVMYRVINRSATDMYFSIGGHPAFKVPLVDGTTYDDYYLAFNKKENLPRWPISKDGLIEKQPMPFLNDTNILPLKKDLFFQDALVFKHPSSSMVSLKSSKTKHGLDFDFSGFPYLGIWAAKNADFVCIEPWCGIADSVDTDQQITHKEGINKLASGNIFERSWSVTII